MFSYEDIADRFWNMPQKGTEEINRENNFIDDIIQKSHIEKELEKNLSGVTTVFDGGAGAGRFSVFLAKKGINVVHFDISDSMLNVAREYAKREGVLERIEFVKGRLGDLSAFGDNSFDMVISFDAPISYTFPNHEEVIKNLVRISRNKIILSVSSRLGSMHYLLNPKEKLQYIMDMQSKDQLVKWYINHSDIDFEKYQVDIQKVNNAFECGLMEKSEDVKEDYLQGNKPWPVTYLFMPEELKEILEKNGVKVRSMAGPGAFSRSIPNEVLLKIMNNHEQRGAFLDFCYKFDKQPSVVGLGKDNLLVTGMKSKA